MIKFLSNLFGKKINTDGLFPIDPDPGDIDYAVIEPNKMAIRYTTWRGKFFTYIGTITKMPTGDKCYIIRFDKTKKYISRIMYDSSAERYTSSYGTFKYPFSCPAKIFDKITMNT